MKTSPAIFRFVLLGIFLGGLIAAAPAQNVALSPVAGSTFSASVKPAALANPSMGPALPTLSTLPSPGTTNPLILSAPPTFPGFPPPPGIIYPTNPIIIPGTLQPPVVLSRASLINLDLGAAGARGYSLKTGFAALGQGTNDFWNFYDRDLSSAPNDWRTSETLTNLMAADRRPTGVNVNISDAPGAWGNNSSDPMYHTYDYPLDGGDNVVTFTGLAPGEYEVLAYSPDGNYEVTVGETSYGIKTNYDSSASQVPLWTEGVQYARWQSVIVAAGQSLVLTVRNGIGGYAILSGVQIYSVRGVSLLPAGLIGWWKGNGNTSDSIGGNDGINLNVGYTNGEVGQAFAFDPENFTDGTYTGIQIADRPAYALTNALTIEGWVRPRGDSYNIFWRGDHRPGLDPYYLSMQGNHTLRFGICDADGNTAFVDTTLNYFTWTHVAATLDGDSGTLSIYTNGVLAAQTTTSLRPFGQLLPDQSPGVGIGNLNDGGNTFPFIGDIDEISLYNRALSIGEIQMIYDAGSAGKYAIPSLRGSVAAPAGLVGWWKGEDNILDSVTGNNGTAPNGVAFTAGIVGQAFSFNGSNSYVEVPDAAALRLTNDLTIEFWAKRQQIDGRPYGDIVMEKGGDWTGGAENYGVGFAPVGYGNRFQFFFAGGNRGCGNVDDLDWHYYAVVVHNGDTDPVFYIDGVPQPVTEREGVATINLYPSTAPLHIGAQIDPNYVYYSDTLIDELSLYNRALSSNDIAAIYGAGSAGKSPLPVELSVATSAPVGLLAWWKGQDNANDSAGNFNGTWLNGADYAGGKVGDAFRFGGSSRQQSLDIPYAPALVRTNYSVEAWINPQAEPGNEINQDWVFGQCYGTAQLVVRTGTTGVYVAFQFSSGGTYGPFNDVVSTGEIPLNQFTHVVGTWDGVTLKLYLNGVLNNSRTVGAVPLDTGCDFYIGGVYHSAADNCSYIGQFFTGVIDEVSFYGRPLSPVEIAALYNAGSAGKWLIPPTNAPVLSPAGLISWWKAEGNTLDSAGTNNGIVTVGDVGYAPAEVGLGFDFDGNAHRILVPDAPALNFDAGQDFSIEGWISPLMPPPDLTYGVMTIVDKRKVLNISQCLGYEFSLVDGQLNVRLSDSLSGIGNNWIGGPDLRDGKMHHVAVSLARNSTNGGNLYVDGVCVLQFDPTSESGSFFNTEPLHIGDHPDPTFNSFFKGRIDEISIYNRALSSNEIGAIYNAGSAGKQLAPPAELNSVPQIFNLAPAAAMKGAIVQISGDNFNTDSTGDIVYFGAVQATVLSATKTNLIVRVPVGATYAPVSVTVAGRTAYSRQNFEPTFLGDGSALSPASFGSRLDLPAGNGPGKVVIADLDGDGKPDLIVENTYNNTISLYRNISTQGTLTADSFAPRIDLATPVGQNSPYWLAAADIDGDGKLDLIVSDYGNNMVSVYRNTCTPGTINSNTFATRVDFACGSQPEGIEIKDVDGDGRPDILTANSGDGTISILRNTSVAGSLTTNSFAPHLDIQTGGSCDSVVVGDLDGDGKPDIAVANLFDGTVSLLRNIGSPGSITADSFAPKTDLAVAGTVNQMTMGDVDGDGKLDLIVAATSPAAVYLLHNNSTSGNLAFAQPVSFPLGGWGHSSALADLDGDGKPDLAVVSELDSLLSVFQNISSPGSFDSGSLAPRVDFGTGWNPWGVTAGDLDGDGRPDLVFCNQYDGMISIYQNEMPMRSGGLPVNPPVITSQPASQTVAAGTNVTFSVTANGGILAYQWRFNGTNLAGATHSTLTLTNVQPNQAGNYSVRVSSRAGGAVISSNATLVVTTQIILVYGYSGTEKVTTAQQEFSYAYAGQMFFVPGQTNGVFVGWATISGKRQYWVSPFSDYQVITLPGAGRTYTILGKAGNDTDTNGRPHIWSYLHKGLNISLALGGGRNFMFPGIFTCNDNHIYPDPQTGNMVLREAVSTYNYIASATQTANNTGQTVADLVDVLTRSLIQQGYTRQ